MPIRLARSDGGRYWLVRGTRRQCDAANLFGRPSHLLSSCPSLSRSTDDDTSPELMSLTKHLMPRGFHVDRTVGRHRHHRNAPRLPVQETIPTQTISPQTESGPVRDQIPPVEPPSIRDPESNLPAPSGWQARVTPTPHWQPTATRSHRGQKIDKQTWLVRAIAAAILIVLVGAWWHWPRQRPDIYKNYVAIYQELQQRRDIAEDQAAWTEFVMRAKTQFAETVPWLEEKSKPGDREKSLLLYAGRDLQELLELPRTSKSPHLKRLDVFSSSFRRCTARSDGEKSRLDLFGDEF